MTIQQLAHQDSTERATALHGLNAWLDAQQPTPEEQEKILDQMHAEDQARLDEVDRQHLADLDASFIAAVDSGNWDGENAPDFTLADQLAH